MKLFIIGFTQVFFVAANTYFISSGYYLGTYICSFIIPIIWSFNVKRIAFGTLNDRITYAFGAGTGAIVGLAVSNLIFKTL